MRAKDLDVVSISSDVVVMLMPSRAFINFVGPATGNGLQPGSKEVKKNDEMCMWW